MQKANCNFTRFSLCLSISLTKSYNNIILLTIYKKPEVTIIFMTSDSLYLFYTVLTPKSASLSGLSFPCFSWIILLLISKRSWIDGCYYFFMTHPDSPSLILSSRSRMPFSSAAAICGLAATRPPPRLA